MKYVKLLLVIQSRHYLFKFPKQFKQKAPVYCKKNCNESRNFGFFLMSGGTMKGGNLLWFFLCYKNGKILIIVSKIQAFSSNSERAKKLKIPPLVCHCECTLFFPYKTEPFRSTTLFQMRTEHKHRYLRNLLAVLGCKVFCFLFYSIIFPLNGKFISFGRDLIFAHRFAVNNGTR